MITTLSGSIKRPSLVTMEGDNFTYDDETVPEYLGIDDDDFEMLGCGALSGEDINYLNNRYPEYMGIWPIIAKIGKAIITVVPKIVKGVRKRKAARASKKQRLKSELDQKMQAMIEQVKRQAIIRKQQLLKKSNRKKIIMIGVPVAGLLLYMIISRPGQARYPERTKRYAVRSRR